MTAIGGAHSGPRVRAPAQDYDGTGCGFRSSRRCGRPQRTSIDLDRTIATAQRPLGSLPSRPVSLTAKHSLLDSEANAVDSRDEPLRPIPPNAVRNSPFSATGPPCVRQGRTMRSQTVRFALRAEWWKAA
jgi:hypothetical protein